MSEPASGGARQPRFFTVEEASRTLPLVARIVRDIVDGYPEFQRKRSLYRQLDASTGEALGSKLQSLSDAVDAYAERLHGYLRELDQVGCVVKDFQEGLIDFHSLYRGRPVLLCWKLGESRVAFWHEIDGGFAGRQPITPEIAEEIRRELP